MNGSKAGQTPAGDRSANAIVPSVSFRRAIDRAMCFLARHLFNCAHRFSSLSSRIRPPCVLSCAIARWVGGGHMHFLYFSASWSPRLTMCVPRLSGGFVSSVFCMHLNAVDRRPAGALGFNELDAPDVCTCVCVVCVCNYAIYRCTCGQFRQCVDTSIVRSSSV